APNSCAIDLKNAPKLYATPYTGKSAKKDTATISHACGESSCAMVALRSASAVCAAGEVISANRHRGRRECNRAVSKQSYRFYRPGKRRFIVASSARLL